MNVDETYCKDGEIWKEIPGFEKLYEASNLGRIRSVDGKITYTERHGARKWKGRILKNKTKIPHNSGFRVSLWKDGEEKTWLSHRLVAMAFLGIPKDIEIKGTGQRMTVNHKDGNRLNNRIENLEWLTLEDNIKHAFKNDLMSTCKKVVLIIDSKRKEFRSMSEAGKYLGRSDSYISNCIKRKTKIRDSQNKEIEVIVVEEKKYIKT